jgi:hypothetical protein
LPVRQVAGGSAGSSATRSQPSDDAAARPPVD